MRLDQQTELLLETTAMQLGLSKLDMIRQSILEYFSRISPAIGVYVSAWIAENLMVFLFSIMLLMIVVLFVYLRLRLQKKKKYFAGKSNCGDQSPLFRSEGSITTIRCGGNVVCCSKSVLIRDSNYESEEWKKLLRYELSRLSVGIILFNPSDTMRSGVLERIEARISRELHLNLRSKLKGSGIPHVEYLKISELMKVRLSGEDFKIIPLNEEEQLIGETGFTEWAWDVTPIKSGRKLLHLHATLRIKLPFGEEKKDHPILDKEIYVQVNPVYSIKLFIVKYWQWIATTLILPLAVWFWKAYLAK